MRQFTGVTLIAGLLPIVCLAQDRRANDAGIARQGRAASQFFYTVPEAAEDEWAYSLPECVELSKADRVGLKNCGAFNGRKHHQMCGSAKHIDSENVLTKETRKFSLIYHIFPTKSVCVKDREQALEGH